VSAAGHRWQRSPQRHDHQGPGRARRACHQLELRIAEFCEALAAAHREAVSAAAIQRAVALFHPVWDLLLAPARFRILHLLLESVGYDGSTDELELAFYPLGIDSLAAEAAMIGQPDAEAA
jgi:site-specific DNA recombinase